MVNWHPWLDIKTEYTTPNPKIVCPVFQKSEKVVFSVLPLLKIFPVKYQLQQYGF
jgi:hypothetical protein